MFDKEKQKPVSESSKALTNLQKRPYQPLATRAWVLWIYISVLLTCILLLQFLLVFGSDFRPAQTEHQIVLRSLTGKNFDKYPAQYFVHIKAESDTTETDRAPQYGVPIASTIQKYSRHGYDLNLEDRMPSLSLSYREVLSSSYSHTAANTKVVFIESSRSIRSATSAPTKTRSSISHATQMISIHSPSTPILTTTGTLRTKAVAYSPFKIVNRDQPTSTGYNVARDTITTTATATTMASSQIAFGNTSPNGQSPDFGHLMTIKTSVSAPASLLAEKLLSDAKDETASAASFGKAPMSVAMSAMSSSLTPTTSLTSQVVTPISTASIVPGFSSSKSVTTVTSILVLSSPDPTIANSMNVITMFSVTRTTATGNGPSTNIDGNKIPSTEIEVVHGTSISTDVTIVSEPQKSVTMSQSILNPSATSISSTRLNGDKVSGQIHSSMHSVSATTIDRPDLSFTSSDLASTATTRQTSSPLSTKRYSSDISSASGLYVFSSMASGPSSKTKTSQSIANDQTLTSPRPYSVTSTTQFTEQSGQTSAMSSVVSNLASPSASAYSHMIQLNNVGDMTQGQYFQIFLLPKLLAVAMQNVWSASHAAMKVMAPFIQLSSIEGATVQQTLMADYLTGEMSWASCVSMFRGQWTILFCNLTSVAMFVLVTLVAESFKILPTASCQTELSDNQPCNPVLFANPVIVHTVQALLGLMIVSLMTLIFMKRKQRLAIFSDPSTLASLATLLGHPTIMSTLFAADSRTKDKSLQQQFRNEKFVLSIFSNTAGHRQYGLVKLDSQDPVSETSDLLTHKQKGRHWTWRGGHALGSQTCLEIAVLGLILGLFSIILAYRLVGGPGNAFNNFMAGGSIGPIFILSLAALLAGNGFKSIERGVRSLEPFRIMAKSPQRGSDSVLTSLGGTAYFGAADGMLHQRWFASLVSMTAILSDMMGIVVAGVPYEAGQTKESYLVCTYSSLAVLIMMAFVLAATTWRRKSNPKSLPPPPESLTDVMSYLSQSNLLKHDTFAATDQELRHVFKDRYFILTAKGEMNTDLKWTVDEIAGMGDQESLCSK